MQAFVKKWGSTTIESGPRYIYILKSFVFSDENYMISSVLSVLSCYISIVIYWFNKWQVLPFVWVLFRLDQTDMDAV